MKYIFVRKIKIYMSRERNILNFHVFTITTATENEKFFKFKIVIIYVYLKKSNLQLFTDPHLSHNH